AQALPRQTPRIALVQHGDHIAVDDDRVAARLHTRRERPVDAVAPQQVGERLGVGEIVDRDPVDRRAALVRSAKGGAPHPSEAVDRNLCAHGLLLLRLRSRPRRPKRPRPVTDVCSHRTSSSGARMRQPTSDVTDTTPGTRSTRRAITSASACVSTIPDNRTTPSATDTSTWSLA